MALALTATRQDDDSVLLEWTGAVDGPTITLATSAAADDIIDTTTAHGFAIGDTVRFVTLTGGTGLTAGTSYFVVSTSFAAQTFRVSTTAGGAAINFTSDITAGTVVKAVPSFQAKISRGEDGIIATIDDPLITSYLDDVAPADATPYSIRVYYLPSETAIDTADAAEAPPTPALIAWTLINPLDDTVLGEFVSGDEVSLPFALEAIGPAGTSSIRFSGSGSANRTENNAPFAPFADATGNYAPANVPAGPASIRAEAFNADNATGTLLADEILSFTVLATPPSPPPPPPPPPDPWEESDKWRKIPAEVRQWVLPPQGWKRTGLDLFSTNIAQGQWGLPGGTHEFPRMTEGDWRWRATAYSGSGGDSSKRGHYSGKDTAWVEDAELREHIRFGVKGVLPFAHNAAGVPLVNRPLLVAPERTPSYSDITRRPAWCIDLYAKYPGGMIESFKCAHLLWGESTIGTVGYAEYDIPEFKFGNGLRGNAFFHNEGTVGGQESRQLNIDTTVFHHYRLIYHAKGYRNHPTGFAEAWLDGNLVLRKTTNISTRSLYYAKQTETYLKGQKIAGEVGGPTLNSSGPQGIIYTRLFQICEPI